MDKYCRLSALCIITALSFFCAGERNTGVTLDEYEVRRHLYTGAGIMAGSYGNGLYIKRRGEAGWMNLTSHNSELPDDYVSDIVFVPEKRVCIATNRGVLVTSRDKILYL